MFHGVDPGSEDGALAGVVNRNIKALIEFRREIEQRRSFQDRFADAVTRFAGSMPFVYLHAGLLGFWLAANSGIFPHLKPWDPFPFVMLAMIASVEAIFLTTFVLVSNNRQAAIQARQSDLDLQISLLAEHEITRLIALAEAIAKRLNVPRVRRISMN